MSRWLDPTGRSTFGIGLCARCAKKFSLDNLFDDPNTPGLKVCRADMDEYDPYRLAPRADDPIALRFNRPDLPLGLTPAGLLTDDYFYFIVTEDYSGYLVP